MKRKKASVQPVRSVVLKFRPLFDVVRENRSASESVIFYESILHWVRLHSSSDTLHLLSLEQPEYVDEKEVYTKANYRLPHGTYKVDLPKSIATSDDDNPIGVEIEFKRLPMENAYSDQRDQITLRFTNPITEKQLLHWYNVMYLSANDPEPATQVMVLIDGGWETLFEDHPRSLDTVYLPKGMKKRILEELQDFFDDEDFYVDKGLPYRRTFLFEGLPGTGKSTLIKGLAAKFNCDLARITVDAKLTDKKLFSAVAELPKRTFLMLEDIDCLFTERQKDDTFQQLSFSGLLNALDGVCRKYPIICFLTTNYKDKLDHALLRPGRIDSIYHFGSATKAQVIEMFQVFRPEVKHRAKEFYQAIPRGSTISVLQKLFVDKRKSKNIFDEISYIKDILDQHRVGETERARSMVL